MSFTEFKLDTYQIKKDLHKAIHECSERGLFQTVKWLTELNFSINDIKLAPEDIPIIQDDLDDERATYLLAKSYYNLKEYDRCAHFLRNCSSQKAKFLNYYSRYLAIEKRKLDNMTNTNCPPDPTQNDKLFILYSEIKNEFNDNKLDGYNCYLHGLILLRLDMKCNAIDVLVKAIQEEPLLWGAWSELSKLINDKHSDKINKLPDHWMKLFFTADTNLEQYNNEKALHMYERFYSMGLKNNSYIMSQIALAYHNLRKLQDAINMFKKILDFDTYRLDNLDIYSNLLYVLEMKTELADLAHKVNNIDKYRVETCCVIGNYYSLRSEHVKAVLYFKRALKLNPHFLSAWTLMGHEYMEMKNPNAAVQSYRYAIEVNPRDYRAWYGLGQTYEILRMPFYCLYYYKQAQQLKPNDSRMIIALGETYEKLDRTENALKCYYKACSIGDVEGNAIIKLAKLYDKLNETDNAAAVFVEYCLREEERDDKAAEDQIEYYNALQYLSNYYLKKGDLDDAYIYAYKCMECDETKEQGKALLKTIAAKRFEQEREAEAAKALAQVEESPNGDKDDKNETINGSSEMDFTF